MAGLVALDHNHRATDERHEWAVSYILQEERILLKTLLDLDGIG